MELSSGEVGVVIETNRRRPDRPKVLLVLRPDQAAYKVQRIVDLDATPGFFGRESRLTVNRALAPQSFGIDGATLAAANHRSSRPTAA